MKDVKGKTLLVFALVLGGCTTTNTQSTWLCPIDQGKGCQTITAADDYIYGRSGSGHSLLGNDSRAKSYGLPIVNLAHNTTPMPKRLKEAMYTIYFYPFVDSRGNYHRGDTLYKVFLPARWGK